MKNKHLIFPIILIVILASVLGYFFYNSYNKPTAQNSNTTSSLTTSAFSSSTSSELSSSSSSETSTASSSVSSSTSSSRSSTTSYKAVSGLKIISGLPAFINENNTRGNVPVLQMRISKGSAVLPAGLTYGKGRNRFGQDYVVMQNQNFSLAIIAQGEGESYNENAEVFDGLEIFSGNYLDGNIVGLPGPNDGGEFKTIGEISFKNWVEYTKVGAKLKCEDQIASMQPYPCTEPGTFVRLASTVAFKKYDGRQAGIAAHCGYNSTIGLQGCKNILAGISARWEVK